MRFQPVRRLDVFYEPEVGRRQKVGRLATTSGRDTLFEYDPGFIDTGLELSPFKLPLQRGVTQGDRSKFDGLMGVFDDSLPDGWGRMLMDRRAAKAGIPPARIGPLDRLSLVGSRGMGALVYEPHVEADVLSVLSLQRISDEIERVLGDGKGVDLDALIAVGGSPQGARPKALVQVASDGGQIRGDAGPEQGWTAWLVKFPSPADGAHSAPLEHAYMRMAAAAGIDVPETALLGASRGRPGFFAIRRFDREGNRRIHQHTVAGLLHAPHTAAVMTYEGLLQLTRELTRDEAAVAELFRRAAFNVFAHNRDDHTRNFSFLMSERGVWTPSPAYDLTFSQGPGGEHTLLVGSEGKRPGREHLLRLAKAVGVRRPAALIDEVRDAVDSFPRFGSDAGVPRHVISAVAKVLGASTVRTSSGAKAGRAARATKKGRSSPKGSPRKQPGRRK